MALKKPSQLFESKQLSGEVPTPVRTSTPLMNNFNETFDRFKNNLDKVDELNEKIALVVEDLNTKLSKEELEGAIFSHLVVVEENFRELERQFKDISKKSLREFKADVTELSEIVESLVEQELPVYKKKVTETEVRISQQFNSLQETVESEISDVEESLQEKIEDLSSGLENRLSGFDATLQETKSDVLGTIETYNKLRKILENKILNDEEKIQEYSQVLEEFNQRFDEFESSVSSQVEDYEKTFSSIVEQLNESIENKFNTYDNEIEVFKEEVNKNLSNIKADVVINEQHLKKVEKYLQENHQELVDLKEEVFGELGKLLFGDVQENVRKLERKLEYIEEVYKNIEPEVIVKEVIQEGLLNEPPSTKNSDSLTPLDKNFVTLDQLQQHYRLFLNRIQQQLATIGGGGETRLKYLDDIVGIATNASAYDGKYLKYNHSLGKFEFTDVDITNDSWSDGINGPYTLGSVGIGLTNPTERLDVSGSIKLTGAIYGPSTLIIDPAVVGDDTGAVRIKGDLYVDGTQTYINSTTLEIADYQVGIATTAGTNIVLDGAGIGIGSANIRKTITWNNSASALTSSENWNLASGKQYEINETSVLSSTTLGTGVTNSSLTSVGTLGQLNVSGVATVGSNFLVNSGTLYVDATNNSVGINTLSPIQPFQVGAAGTNTVVVTGIGSVGIGITNPDLKLVVANSNIKVNGITIGVSKVTSNISIGNSALVVNTPSFSDNNIAIGQNALLNNVGATFGRANIAIGGDALKNNSGENNTAIGYRCLENNQQFHNCAVGFWALRNTTTGGDNIAVGGNSNYQNTSGGQNSSLGHDSLFSNLTGSYNVALGKESLQSNTTGNYNIGLGAYVGVTTNRSRKILIGSGNGSNRFDSPNTTSDTQLAIGQRTGSGAASYWIVGNENYNIGIGTTNPTSKLQVVGDGRFTGVVTATTFIGAVTGIAASATQLVNPRTFEITGDIVASPIAFDGTGNVSLAATIQPNSVGLGTDTTGDYVQNISGTSNQITVTGGTGEGSSPTLSLPTNLVVPQDLTVTRDLQVNRNLNVTGNITIGGTTAFVNVQELVVSDPDIVLGYRTDAFGNDVSNDNTANHGGIGLASTEGNPLVDLFIAGIETNPATYKKIMWFKEGTFAGLGTDAWLINYAVGIGSTQFPTGTRLAAGSVQFTERDLAVVRDINASGIVTGNTANFTNSTLTNISSSGISTLGITSATDLTAQQLNVSGIVTGSSFRPSSGYYQSGNGTNSFYVYDGTGNVAFQGTIGASQINNASGYKALDFSSSTTPIVQITNGLSVSGVSTLGVTTTTNLTAQQLNVSGVATVGSNFTVNSGTLYVDATNNRVGINTLSPVQPLQVNSGSNVVVIDSMGDIGIGTTNPTQALDVRGNVLVSGFSSVTDTRLNSVSEKTTIGVGNTVSLVYNTGGGNIGIITSPSGPLRLNVTGIPTDSSFDNRSLTFSVMVNQGVSVAYACSTITLNGVTPTIRWPGGVVAVGATNSYDIFNFTCINPTGSASTTTNYVVLGVLNGNFK